MHLIVSETKLTLMISITTTNFLFSSLPHLPPFLSFFLFLSFPPPFPPSIPSSLFPFLPPFSHQHLLWMGRMLRMQFPELKVHFFSLRNVDRWLCKRQLGWCFLDRVGNRGGKWFPTRPWFFWSVHYMNGTLIIITISWPLLKSYVRGGGSIV